MGGQKSRASVEAPGIETIKEDVVLKYDDPPGTSLQSFTQTGHVGFKHALLDILGMPFDNDKFNPAGQADFIELAHRRLSPVFPFFDRNAVNAIEKIPDTVLIHHFMTGYV
ncbi:MAG: hypothetical protein JXL20_01180 [Deltaproteobacteria bacterium]|nr:hypothetical protein [Deltaproteobacteria bacterium]